jgi:hypothetical protein
MDAQTARPLDRHGVEAPKGVAVVLDEPQVAPAAELKHGTDVERVAQRVRHHHRLRPSLDEGLLELRDQSVAGDDVTVDEDGDRPDLDDRRDGRREPRGDRDDLASRDYPLLGRQLVAREKGERDQVRRGAGVDEDRVFDTQVSGQLPLEGLALLA